MHDNEVHFFTAQRITVLVRFITVIIASTVILTPVLIFSLMDLSQKAASCVVLVFVLAFVIVMLLLTEAKMEDLFIGTYATSATKIADDGATRASLHM